MKKVVVLMALLSCMYPVLAEEYKTITCYELGGLEKVLPKEGTPSNYPFEIGR